VSKTDLTHQSVENGSKSFMRGIKVSKMDTNHRRIKMSKRIKVPKNY